MNPDRPYRVVPLLSVLLLLGTFTAGAVAGVGLCRWSMAGERRHMGPPPPFPLFELGLSPEQMGKARAILDRHRPELEAVLQETMPRVRAINEKVEQEIRPILTAEQVQKLDKLRSRRPPPGRGGLLPGEPPLPPPPGAFPPPAGEPAPAPPEAGAPGQ